MKDSDLNIDDIEEFDLTKKCEQFILIEFEKYLKREEIAIYESNIMVNTVKKHIKRIKKE